MPNTRSAKKALRQSLKRRARNLARKKAIREAKKAYLKAIEKGDKKEALEKLKLVYKAIDKAAKTFLHKNTAARKKSRLAKKLNQLSAT